MAYDDHVEEAFQSEMQRQEAEQAVAQSLWDIVKQGLSKRRLLEVAAKFPQFAKEASLLAAEVTLREERESRSNMAFEDQMRAIGNDRL